MRSDRDHPRSRGVYLDLAVTRVENLGSSPLARGLREAWLDWLGQPRIIPARAGFTSSTRHRPTGASDHPRSRGVYSALRTSPASSRGSSPLARGLPLSNRRPHLERGIIPARAGFTSVCETSARRPWDHPRSRGVYLRHSVTDVDEAGSSPLARGLLGDTNEKAAHRRIIPARAGFTFEVYLEITSGPDHPRSRGVYSADKTRRKFLSGSSPLARGLRADGHRTLLRARIIPARAGFTDGITPPDMGHQDHPRSRGVYPPLPWDGSLRCGSSPLARGLLATFSCPGLMAGIIPARAGFTVESSMRYDSIKDHPRSRGVYTCGSLESQR